MPSTSTGTSQSIVVAKGNSLVQTRRNGASRYLKHVHESEQGIVGKQFGGTNTYALPQPERQARVHAHSHEHTRANTTHTHTQASRTDTLESLT